MPRAPSLGHCVLEVRNLHLSGAVCVGESRSHPEPIRDHHEIVDTAPEEAVDAESIDRAENSIKGEGVARRRCD